MEAAPPSVGSLCQQEAASPTAQGAPLQAIMFANGTGWGHSGGSVVLRRAAKPALATAGITLPWEQQGTWCVLAPHHPTSLLPLLLPTPLRLRGAPVALSKTKQLHQPSHRHWGRSKIRSRFSSPGRSKNQRRASRHPWSWSMVGAYGTTPLCSQPQPPPPPMGTATASGDWT